MSPVDSFLNRKSKNAIANNAVAEAIERIEQDIERLEGLKASLTQSGSVQLSSASDVTDSTGMALPVTEKNPTIEGTLANKIEQVDEKIEGITIFSAYPTLNDGNATISCPKATSNSIALVANAQGNQLAITSMECRDGEIVIKSSAPASGIIRVVVAIKF